MSGICPSKLRNSRRRRPACRVSNQSRVGKGRSWQPRNVVQVADCENTVPDYRK